MNGRLKRAELAGAAGAGVLGMGLGAMLGQWILPYASFLLGVGIVLHGFGMWEKHRLEAGAEVPLWSKVLYWLCWIILGILIIWIGIKVFRG